MSKLEPHRVLVTGGRTYSDRTRVAWALKAVDAKYPIGMVIQGGARGADELCKRWAQDNGVYCRQFDADWNSQPRSGGHIRNADMLRVGQPDFVVAFEGGAGTASMIKMARKAGVPVWEVPPR